MPHKSHFVRRCILLVCDQKCRINVCLDHVLMGHNNILINIIKTCTIFRQGYKFVQYLFSSVYRAVNSHALSVSLTPGHHFLTLTPSMLSLPHQCKTSCKHVKSPASMQNILQACKISRIKGKSWHNPPLFFFFWFVFAHHFFLLPIDYCCTK